MPITRVRSRFAAIAAAAVVTAACGDTTSPIDTGTPESLRFTAATINSLDSTGHVIITANPGRGDLQSLVDSTLGVLTAGIDAKRIDITTNVTSKPLYFVGIHRVVSRAAGSFSTWTVVGIDDPAKLETLIEVSGFASSSNATVPASVNATIGDGSGFVNARFLQVAAGGAVTQWAGSGGAVKITSGSAGAACPGFVAITNITCAMETIRLQFNATATGSAGSRNASVATEVDVPTMRLTYTGQ